MMNTDDRKFQTSEQSSIKIEIALRKLAAGDTGIYRDYIKQRAYSALLFAVQKNEEELLDVLLDQGMIDAGMRQRIFREYTAMELPLRLLLMGGGNRRDSIPEKAKERLTYYTQRIGMQYPVFRIPFTELSYEECSMDEIFALDGKTVCYDPEKMDVKNWKQELALFQELFISEKKNEKGKEDFWSTLALRMGKGSGPGSAGGKGGSHAGVKPGSRREKMILRQEGQYDFTNYLKRFSVTKEELQLDYESFDYIPYSYGMQYYGNMPFLEPLEYTEASKVEELVIAIDTSSSCSRKQVQRFLAETRKLLTGKQNFFRKMNVHILQCDAMIQQHIAIHSVEEWNNYIEKLQIVGRGGTDFTPVFTYIKQLQDEGEIKNLKGLLYFTDGDGIYPSERPEYETAFVFPRQECLEQKRPDWVVPLCLEA